MSEKLELAIVELIKKERFFAEMLLRMKRIPDYDMQTIGVIITPDGVQLRYNPAFIKDPIVAISQDLDRNGIGTAASILKHECEHIMWDHTDRRKVSEPDLFKEETYTNILDSIKATDTVSLLNMAEDLAINEHIPTMPKKFHLYDKEGQAVKKEDGSVFEADLCSVELLQKWFPDTKVERNQTTEYYYQILKQIKQKKNKDPNQNGKGQVMVTIDQHGKGDPDSENGQMDPEVAKQLAKQLVNEAFEATPGSERGKLPGHIVQLIKELNSKTHDWRKDLRQFKESCMAVIQEETRRRRNRRYGLLYPGRRSKPKMHLVTVIDSSGSVNDDAIVQIMSEIGAINKLGVDVTVVECDSMIRNVYSFDPKKKIDIKGRGGTAFSPAFDLVSSIEFKKEYGKPDGLIYLTDGENYDVKSLSKPKYRVLWALLPGCKVAYEWGGKTWIEVNNDKRKRA